MGPIFARSGILLAAMLSVGPAGAADQEPPAIPEPEITAPAAPITPDPSELVNEVTVIAPEPRYVAPTTRDSIGRVWAPVLINGRGPFRLVLDTGASKSAVLARVADSLGLPMKASSMRVHGVTGSALVASISVDRLEVGDLLMEATTLPVVPDVFGGADGVLGGEALNGKCIVIDFRRDRIEISHTRKERLGQGFRTIPLKLSQNRLLSFETRIGAVEATAVIDTGAQRTLGNHALREALKRRARHGQEEEIVGVTLEVEKGNNIPTPPIMFGKAAIRGLSVTFAETAIFDHWKLTQEPALLLGMDVLGLMDVLIIDYRRRQMHVRLRAAPTDQGVGVRHNGSRIKG
jgi:Aspartyl protease